MNSITAHAIPGGWTEREIRLGERVFSLLVPANPHAILDSPELEAGDALEPYWVQLWTAAQPTAEAVLGSVWKPGTRVLELGCGIGLVGLAALCRGLHVTFSDYQPLAVALALENARRHGFPAGDHLSHVEGWVLDWRDAVDRRFPVVLGSDILYEVGNHVPLAELLERVLTPDGVCWIGDAGRYHASRFAEVAESRGFQVTLVDEAGRRLAAARTAKYQRFILQRMAPSAT